MSNQEDIKDIKDLLQSLSSKINELDDKINNPFVVQREEIMKYISVASSETFIGSLRCRLSSSDELNDKLENIYMYKITDINDQYKKNVEELLKSFTDEEMLDFEVRNTCNLEKCFTIRENGESDFNYQIRVYKAQILINELRLKRLDKDNIETTKRQYIEFYNNEIDNKHKKTSHSNFWCNIILTNNESVNDKINKFLRIQEKEFSKVQFDLLKKLIYSLDKDDILRIKNLLKI
jgi:hypothetical protein